VIHTFGTVATGGFSSNNASIGAYGAYVHYVIIVFMFLSGINFILYCRLLLGDRLALYRNTELRFYSLIIFIFTIILTFNLWGKAYLVFEEAFRHALFQVTSIVTTTGYVTADFDGWPHVAKMILFIAMFVGGCAGSTGSSIKVVRIYVALKAGWNELFRTVHPAAVKTISVNTGVIPYETTRKITRFFIVYLMIIGMGSVVMSFFDLDIVSALSATAATLGNVGPGFGLVGAVESYAFLPATAKIILSFFMLLGRLEIFTFLVIFAPSFWQD